LRRCHSRQSMTSTLFSARGATGTAYYIFMENIQRGKGRVDMQTMEIDDTETPTITGGYVFRKEKTAPNALNFSGGENLQMIYPREEEHSARHHQRDWLSEYLGTMSDAIRDHDSDPE